MSITRQEALMRLLIARRKELAATGVRVADEMRRHMAQLETLRAAIIERDAAEERLAVLIIELYN